MPPETLQQNWIDITTTIAAGMTPWPNQGEVVVRRMKSIGKGAEANVTELRMSAHTGTHMDAPLHFFNDGTDMSKTNIDALIGPAKIFEIADREKITLTEIQQFDITDEY